MPNNRAAASPKRAPCRFEGFMGGQLTEDKRKVQRMRRYRRPSRTLPRWQWRGTSGGTPRAAKQRPGSISLPMDTVAWFALESIDLLDFEWSEEKCQTTW